MYFTEMYGAGSQWVDVGQTALYSSSKTGFRVYIQKAAHLGTVASWRLNALVTHTHTPSLPPFLFPVPSHCGRVSLSGRWNRKAKVAELRSASFHPRV
jgi:hypothetical protein